MTTTIEAEIEREIGGIVDPILGETLASLNLIEAVSIDESTEIASVRLRFNAPYSPRETEMGMAVRDAIEEYGYEPDLSVTDPGVATTLPEVRNVIAVASGKGGVGKTTVAVNLAEGLNRMGASVGIVDGDIHGPNVPELLETDEEPHVLDDGTFLPAESDGLKAMSLGHIVPREDDPAALRGPMVEEFLLELFNGVEWGALDYLVVDLPPGTGDATFSLVQNVAVTGAVIVTTPHEMSVIDARKGLRMFRQHDVPVIGVVENMSSFACPNCDETHELYGSGGGEETAEKHGVPHLGEIPFDPRMNTDGEVDRLAVRSEENPTGEAFRHLAPTVADLVGEVNRRLTANGQRLRPSPATGECG